MRLLHSSLWTAGTSLLVTASSFGAGILLARALGPDGRGSYAVMMLVATLASGLSQLGLGQSFVYTSRQRGQGARRWLVVATIAVVALCAALIGWGLAEALAADISLLVLCALIALCVGQALSTFCSNSLQITGDAREFNVIRLAPALATLCLLSGLALAEQLSVRAALWATGVATALACLTGMWMLLAGKSMNAIFGKGNLNEGWLRFYVGYGIKYHGTVVLGILVQNLDKLALVYLVSMHDFGVYTVAYNTSRFIGVAQEAISMALYSRFAGRNDGNLSASTKVAFQLSFLPMIFLASIIAIASQWLIPGLYGAAYGKAVLPFVLLLFECVLGGASWMLAQRFAADGRPGLVLLRQAVSMVPILVVVLLQPKDDAVIWFATAMVVSAVMRLLLSLLICKMAFGEKIPAFWPSKEQVMELAGKLGVRAKN